jgi:hypothetical protein
MSYGKMMGKSAGTPAPKMKKTGKSGGSLGPKMKTPKAKPSGPVIAIAYPGKNPGKKVNMPGKFGKGTFVKKRML